MIKLNSDKKITIEDVEKAWARFNKLTCERRIPMDIWRFQLPYYNDLKTNWNEEHAEIFMDGMNEIFEHFGIDI